jgi:hypothetical protein
LKVEFSTSETRKFYRKKSRFSKSQIIAILKQAETGTPVPELGRDMDECRVVLQVAQPVRRHGCVHDGQAASHLLEMQHLHSIEPSALP